MTTFIFTFLITFCILCCIVVALVYTIYRDTTKMQNNFNVQIAAAQANQRPEINKLTYQELIKIVNEVINYYTSQNMDVIGLASKNEDEISLILDELTADISTKVKISISPMVSDCILGYITEDFYDRYIFNSVRLLIVANVERIKHKSTKVNRTQVDKNQENR